MLSRRHIRVKVMQMIYAFNNSESIDLKLPQKQLLLSMEDMYNLYLLIISLLIKVHSRAEDYLDKSKVNLFHFNKFFSPDSFRLIVFLMSGLPTR